MTSKRAARAVLRAAAPLLSFPSYQKKSATDLCSFTKRATLKARSDTAALIKMQNSTTTCPAPDASGTTQCFTIYAQSTSTDPTIVNGFTAGEIVISVMLFLILMIASVFTYHILFRRIKIKNQ